MKKSITSAGICYHDSFLKKASLTSSERVREDREFTLDGN